MKKRFTIFSLILVFCFQIVSPVFAESDTIYIRSAKNLIALAQKCKNDTWSQGKTVVLEKNVDLTDSKFTGIPTFGGTFEGNGHTIKGFSLKKNGSNQGFFRYVQAGATVKDLMIEGAICAGGTQANIGGLVGNNSGSIIHCQFNGNIKGSAYVGGLVGVNQSDGLIQNSRSNGIVYGEHYVGGVAGQNLGRIILCRNTASINTSTENTTLNKENMDLSKINSTLNTDKITDLGGIAGYSTGVIQSCTNEGNVGYEHVGYNVGGIVGRQSGYINGCKNSALVAGRKDIGGIAGQMEPYTMVQFSATSLQNVGDELDTLQQLIDQAISHAQVNKDTMHGDLTSTQNYVDDAKSAVDELSDKTSDLINADMDSVNDTISRLTETLDKLADDMKYIENSSDKMSQAIDEFSKAMDTLSKSADSIDTENLRGAIDELKSAVDEMQKAFTYIRRSMNEIEKGLGDLTKLQGSFDDLQKGLSMLDSAMGHMSEAVADLKKANDTFVEILKSQKYATPEQIKAFVTSVSNALGQMQTSFSELQTAISQISKAIRNFPTYILKNALNDFINGIDELDVAIDSFGAAMGHIGDSLDIISKNWDSFKSAADGAKDALDQMSAATKTLKEGVDLLTSGVKSIRSTMQDLADKPTITFQRIDDDYLKTKDKLSDSLSNISQAFRTLNNSAGQLSDTLLSDVKAISNQLFKVFDCMMDSIDDVRDKSTDAKDYFKDVSDEEVNATTEGKVSDSQNTGIINGDVNTGGIAGSMAIEYDFDPEDDVAQKGDKSFNFLYTTRAVAQGCINEGEVNGKKNYVGGIIGKMDLGTLVSCIGSGDVTSDSGNYVGGVAGYSNSTIRQSYAKCTLSGDDYIGGIAGRGKTITDCASIVTIKESDESVGAIAGKVEGTLTNNYFAGENLGGVDGISYTGKAEEKTYTDLITLPNIPDAFHYFTLTFVVEDRVTDKVRFRYGSSLKTSEIPKVPEKDGRFGKWSRKNFDNLTQDETIKAIYRKYITSVESKNQRKNGLPVIVEEGHFASTSKMTLKKLNESPNLKLYEKEIESWSLKVTEDTKEENRVHYLPAEPIRHAEVYVRENNQKWRHVKVETDGQYLVFPVRADQVDFCVVKTNKMAHNMLEMALISCGVILLALLWVSILTKRKQWPIRQKRLGIAAIFIVLVAAICTLLLFI